MKPLVVSSAFRRISPLVVVVVSLALQSCSGIFDLRPSGRVDRGVSFSFYRTSEDTRPSRLLITHIYVQKRSGDGWKTVWELRGDRRMRAITYGHEYRGFRIERAAERLTRGERYRVSASGGPLFGAAEFTIDRAGNVVVVPSDQRWGPPLISAAKFWRSCGAPAPIFRGRTSSTSISAL